MSSNNYTSNILLTVAFVIVAFFSYQFLSKRTENLPKAIKLSQDKPQESEYKKDDFEKNVQEIIKKYLSEHPEEILSSLESLQQKRFEEHKFNIALKIKEKSSELGDSKTFPIFRPDSSNVKIFAFLDYSCIYCKKLNETIKEIANDDPKVSIVYNLYPILGESSLYATKLMIALNKISPENFKEIHDQIMSLKNIDKESIAEILLSKNIEIKALEDEMDKEYIAQYLTKVSSLAKYLSVSGVPVVIIGDKFYPGAIEREVLLDLIKTERNAMK